VLVATGATVHLPARTANMFCFGLLVTFVTPRLRAYVNPNWGRYLHEPVAETPNLEALSCIFVVNNFDFFFQTGYLTLVANSDRT